MDVLIPLALLAVGIVVGFFVARYVYNRDDGAGSSAQAEKNIKEIMAQQAEHHIHQSRQTIDAVEKQCEAMRQQIDEYEALLSQNLDDDAPRVPFYGEHAASYLRNNLQGQERRQQKSAPDTQPRDFANTGSGLFVGSSEQSTAEKK